MVNGKLSSESSISCADMGNKELLELYQNKFDELQKTEDKFREKVDKHLQELIADRYELEAEVCRRGEKISDLQKALVDLQLSCFEERERFLNVSAENERLRNNEEILHKNIQELLKHTKERATRDKIIYILQNPKVEIGHRYAEGRSAGASSSSLLNKNSTDHILGEQIQELQSKVDQYSKITKSNSDVILHDCKITLQKSGEKISEDEKEIRKLQRKLQETESQLYNLKKSYSELEQNVEQKKSQPYCANYRRIESKNSDSSPSTRSVPTVPGCKSGELSDDRNEGCQDIISHMKNINFALNSLSLISSKIISLLNKICSSQIFIHLANVSKEASSEFVEETDIIQLQNCIRQCTRLSYDISNIWKSVQEYKMLCKIEIHMSQREFEHLETVVNDLAVSTAEADLLSIRLSKASFFDYLIRPNKTFEKFGIEETNHSKYSGEMMKMEGNVKSINDLVSTGQKIVERIIQNIEHNTQVKQSKTTFAKSSDQSQIQTQLRKDQPSFHSSRENLAQRSNEHFGSQFGGRTSSEDVAQRSNEDFNSQLGVRKTRSEPIGGDDVIRKINKTLAKIGQAENGEYAKDNEFCRHLGEEINILSEKLKSLYNDFNMKSLQQNFSEYSAVTLRKLETLAKQSRDTVLSAEAQISAYRSNAKLLSQKLRDTEELLRESIGECLALKQKLSQQELQRETDKAKFGENLEQKLQSVSDIDDLETAVKEVISSVKPSSGTRRPAGPYECMFCKQGSDHKMCEEKIREMRANIRKLSTELKILNQELKEEKKTSKLNQEQAEKIVFDSAKQRENVKDTLQSLESKNTSLMEQLKVAKNRLKTMERYRRSEIEGFQTDIKNLKLKINDLEKQLSKAVLIYENDQKSMELLKTVHATAQRSKNAAGSLKRLKAKLYEIETDIKHL